MEKSEQLKALELSEEGREALQYLELARPWAYQYREALIAGDLSPIKKAFRDLESPAGIMSWAYHYLVLRGRLLGIESTALPVKAEFWEEAKDWHPGASVAKTKRIARSIYTMAFILQNNL